MEADLLGYSFPCKITKGVTTSNVTSLRVLLKVDLVVAMLRHGELKEKGVVFDINLVERIMPQKKRSVLHKRRQI